MKKEQQRIRSTLGLVLKNAIAASQTTDFTADLFMLVLKAALHPVACNDRLSLRKMTDKLQSILTTQAYYSLFQQHHECLVEVFLKQRTGILSPNQEVRHLAQNVLVTMSWSGHLDKFLQFVGPIFNYSAIERLD